MIEPFIKVHPSPTPGRVMYEVDQEGQDYLERIVRRSQSRKTDNLAVFRQVKDRVEGALFAGAALMGWARK